MGLQDARPGHLHEGRQRVDHVVGDQVAARLPGLVAAQEDLGPDLVAVRDGAWEKQVLSARGVQGGGKAVRILHIHGVEVRRKRPRGFR